MIYVTARENVQLSKQRTLINTKNTKKHEKTVKNQKANTKTKNHFIGLEHETVVELHIFRNIKRHKGHKKKQNIRNLEKHTTNTEITKT